MSVNVRQEQTTLSITSVPVILTLADSTKIQATCVTAWELNLVDNRVYKIDYHYETTQHVWIDEAQIVEVSLFFNPGDAATDIQWFTYEGQFYYWQDGSYYFADGNRYFGDTTNWEIIRDSNSTTIAEPWTITLAWEYTDNGTFAPITKCTRISNSGALAVKYYRGSTEVFPVLVEDSLPASAYGTKTILLKSGEIFDSRSFIDVIAGIAISLVQVRRHYGPDGSVIPASAVEFTWYNGDVIRETISEVRSKDVLWNAEGGQESITKNFVIKPLNGAAVDIHIRTLEYPIVSASSANAVDAALDELTNVVIP